MVVFSGFQRIRVNWIFLFFEYDFVLFFFESIFSNVPFQNKSLNPKVSGHVTSHGLTTLTPTPDTSASLLTLETCAVDATSLSCRCCWIWICLLFVLLFKPFAARDASELASLPACRLR